MAHFSVQRETNLYYTNSFESCPYIHIWWYSWVAYVVSRSNGIILRLSRYPKNNFIRGAPIQLMNGRRLRMRRKTTMRLCWLMRACHSTKLGIHACNRRPWFLKNYSWSWNRKGKKLKLGKFCTKDIIEDFVLWEICAQTQYQPKTSTPAAW